MRFWRGFVATCDRVVSAWLTWYVQSTIADGERRRAKGKESRYVLNADGVFHPRGWEFVPLKSRGPRPFNRRGHW